MFGSIVPFRIGKITGYSSTGLGSKKFGLDFFPYEPSDSIKEKSSIKNGVPPLIVSSSEVVNVLTERRENELFMVELLKKWLKKMKNVLQNFIPNPILEARIIARKNEKFLLFIPTRFSKKQVGFLLGGCQICCSKWTVLGSFFILLLFKSCEKELSNVLTQKYIVCCGFFTALRQAVHFYR